jgi:transposase
MNNECGMIVDRDINGANNIGSLFYNMIQGKERPEAFRRLLVADEKRSNRKSVLHSEYINNSFNEMFHSLYT